MMVEMKGRDNGDNDRGNGKWEMTTERKEKQRQRGWESTKERMKERQQSGWKKDDREKQKMDDRNNEKDHGEENKVQQRQRQTTKERMKNNCREDKGKPQKRG